MIHILDKAIKNSIFNVSKIIINNELYSKEDIENRIKVLRSYQKKLNKLLLIPKIEQKTDEWYRARENMISASDFGQACGEGKFGNVNQIIQKKCSPVDESAFSKSNPFFKWGNMFEDVAIDIYSDINNVTINSFGLLKHPKFEYLGASPDGISDLGIMVEIKCPYKRKIDGEIPRQYYYQIQGQLEVCNLEECDYFECEFVDLKNYQDFKKEFNNNEYKGIIIEKNNSEFIYSKIMNSNSTFDEADSFLNINNNIPNYKIIYWYLKKYNMKRVIRDKEFIKEKMKELKKIWDKIVYYRNNKDKYILEVLNSIDIDTECLVQETKKINGYNLLDIEDENENKNESTKKTEKTKKISGYNLLDI